MKKISIVILLLTLITAMSIQMTGCSGEAGDENAIAIEDLEITAKSVIIDGEREMGFQFTNNSKYTIDELKVTYTFKKDVEKDLLVKAFGADYEEEGYSLGEILDITIDAECIGEVNPGETSGQGEFEYGMITKQEQFELLEPSILTVEYEDNGKLYTEYYDYINGAYSVDGTIIDLSQWGTMELANKIPRPDDAKIIEVDESDSMFNFSAIGCTLEDYKAYVKKVKDAGFSVCEWEYDCSYDGKTKDGKLSVSIDFDEEDGILTTYLYAK